MRARTFSPSAMVQVWIGGVKYQLTARNPASAATSAGARPPTAEIDDDEQQVQHEHGRQPDVVAELGEERGERRQPDEREQPGDQAATRRDHRPASARQAGERDAPPVRPRAR